jgi:hypothetical protein
VNNVPASSRLVWVRRVALTLLLVDVVAFLIQGSNRPARPSLSPSPSATNTVTTTTPGPAGPTVSVTIIPAAGNGSPTSHCFLLANTPQQRAKGLMGRRSLDGYEGMAFVYAADSNDAYFMRNTLLPLGIAFFSQAGMFLSSAQMPPCPDTTVTCPQYSAAAPFRLALEARIGVLAAQGVGAGAVAHVGGPCSP